MKAFHFVPLLLIYILVCGNLFANEADENAKEAPSSDCFLPFNKTSLDSLYCTKLDLGKDDCQCYGKIYSGLDNEVERLPLVNKGLGKIALKSIEQSFYDIASTAKELSLLDIDFMNGEVASSCRMDNLGGQVGENCGLTGAEVGGRLNKYFGKENGIENLTDFSKFIFKAFEEQSILKTKDSSENLCLSEGEAKSIKNIGDYRSEVNSFKKNSLKNISDFIEGYDGQGKLWSFIKDPDLIKLANLNPLLKIILQNEKLSQNFMAEGGHFEFDFVKKVMSNKGNLEHVRVSMANKCKRVIKNISNLICKDPKNSLVANKIFNKEILDYDPSRFESGYNDKIAKRLAGRKKKEETFYLDRHISFCEAKVNSDLNSCKESEKSCLEVDQALENLTYEVGENAISQINNLENSIELQKLNTSYCPLFYCSNIAEVLQKGATVCKKKNPPNNSKQVAKIIQESTNIPCPAMIGNSPYDCDKGINKIEFVSNFKEFMRVMDEKMGIEKPTVAQGGQAGQASSSSSSSGNYESSGSSSKPIEVKEEKGMFDSFVDNFKGKFAALVRGDEEVTVEKLKSIAPPKPTTKVAGGSQSSGSNVVSGSNSNSGGSDRSNSTAGNTKGTGNVAGGAQGAGGGAGLQNGMAPQNGRFFPGNQAPTSPYPYPYSRAGQGSSASVNPNVSPVTDRALTAQDYFNDMQRLDEMEKELENKKKEYAGLQKERGTSAKERALKDEIAKLSKQIEEEKTKKTNTALGSNNTPYKNTTASSGSRAASNRPTTPSSGGSFGTKPSGGSYQVDNSLPDQDQVAGGAQASVGKSGRSPASAGIAGTTGPGAGGAGGRASASSSNNLPFNEGGSALTKAQADQQAAKVIVIKANEIDLSLQKIDIAAAIRKNNVKLEKGAPFKIDFDGQGTIEFVPQYEKNVFKGYYVPQPADSDLILFLKEAPYWRNVTVKGLNSQLPKRSR